MQQVQFVGISPQQLQENLTQAVKAEISQLRDSLEQSKQERYLSRKDTAKMLGVDLTTLWNWHKKGVLSPVAIGARRFYRFSDIENAMVELK